MVIELTTLFDPIVMAIESNSYGYSDPWSMVWLLIVLIVMVVGYECYSSIVI